MRLLRKLRSYYTFVVRERFGYLRQLHLPFQVTDDDLAKHDEADRELRAIRSALRYLDAQIDVYRRPE